MSSPPEPCRRRADADGWTAAEMMTIAAARALPDGATCLVGIGLPSTAANLARRVHAPGLVLVYESGTIGAKPEYLPLSIGDGILAETADTVVGLVEIFNYWLQPGRIDVGFLGAAQVDRFANINTTVIGDSYASPDGPPARRGRRARDRRLVPRGDHRRCARRATSSSSGSTSSRRSATAPGGDERRRLGLRGGGPTAVITDLGVLEPDPETRELVLTQLHPGVTLAEAHAPRRAGTCASAPHARHDGAADGRGARASCATLEADAGRRRR